MLPRMPSSATSLSSERLEDVRVQHHFVELDEVTLHCVEAGNGPLVVLLHGFPEFWYTWRSILPALARAGFRVVAPDMRGYNLSSRPRGLRPYAITALAKDIAQLIHKLGSERASVVGHDWGANVAWATAMYHPERVDRLGVLNGPHPMRLLLGLLNPRQLLRSWYFFAVLLPRLPELFFGRDNYARIRKNLTRDALRPDAFTSEDLVRYTEAVAQPGALTAMLNYYRAAFIPSRPPKRLRTDHPTLVLWGTHDGYLGRQLAKPSPKLVPNCRVEYVEQAGHYVHHDCPALVSERLVGFLRAANGGG
jgi:pimeloyl-ACP methyl ester carboxylesterase